MALQQGPKVSILTSLCLQYCYAALKSYAHGQRLCRKAFSLDRNCQEMLLSFLRGL